VVVVETEPNEAEEDGNIEHGADAHVTSKVDEEEEAKDHAKREGNVTDEDSIDTDTEESLDNITDKLEEAIDVFARDGEVDLGKLALSRLTLEVSNDVHDIVADTSKKSEESNPADKTKNGELVAKKKNEEDIDNNEASKSDHEIVPHEDLLSLGEEGAVSEGLSDHLAWALTRAGRSRSSSLGGFLLLLLFFGRSGLLGSGFLSLYFFFRDFLRGYFGIFFRHV